MENGNCLANAPSKKVLIAEDEPNALMGLAELISGWGYRTETARDGIEAWEKALAWDPAIVVTDLKMPRLDGIGLLTKLSEEGSGLNSNLAVVVLTAMGSIQLAVDAMKLGAYDFLQKPVDATRLRTILANATRQRETEIELEVARRRLRESGVLGSLVGNSGRCARSSGSSSRLRPPTSHVLITGESGTGKELVARTLHDLSPRKAKPFVGVNCAAIPETLIESEIFGHEKGAFTGAAERRAGCFELATGGTLLLDEVGEMPSATQAKLLRVLEERKLRRLGARTEQDVDVRVLAATNRDPNTGRRPGPSARRPLLPAQRLQHPHAAAARSHGRPAGHGRSHAGRDEPEAWPPRLRRGPVDAGPLMAYDWPGNARELRNTIERAVILCPDGAPLDAGHLPPGFGKAQPQAARPSTPARIRCTWAPPWMRPSGC
jgi:DNA-binding NtrC family response regulator